MFSSKWKWRTVGSTFSAYFFTIKGILLIHGIIAFLKLDKGLEVRMRPWKPGVPGTRVPFGDEGLFSEPPSL